MTDFEEFEGGVAVAKAPEEEQAEAQVEEQAEAQAVAQVEEQSVAQASPAEMQAIEVEAEPINSGIEMEWEVETVPPEEPEVETVTEETVVEEYYEPEYRRSFFPGYDDRRFRREYSRGYSQDYYKNRRVARRLNKHIFTWILSFVLGIYGADRFARGQIGLGMLKLLTFGGFGFWYLYDAAVAIILSYGGAYRDSEDVVFDQYGRYII